MKTTILFFLGALVLFPALAHAHPQTIDFRCIFQYCHERFNALAGVTMYNPETADWTRDGGSGILDADEFTLLSLVFANPAAPHHDDIHNAFLQNSARARTVVGSTIIGLTTSITDTGPTARQPIPGTSPQQYYGVDGVLGGYLTFGEWDIYDETMAGFKDSPFGTATQWTTETGMNDDKKVEYDMDHADLVGMCGNYDGDHMKNCHEFWSDGTYAGAIDANDDSGAALWSIWPCLDEDNSSLRFAYNEDTDRVYVITPGEITWAEALAYTVNYPGGWDLPVRLVTINNVVEDALIASVANGRKVWIGATDAGHDTGHAAPNPDDWYWLSDPTQSPMTYRNWRTGEPNGVDGTADCAIMRYNGGWSDVSETTGEPPAPSRYYAIFETIGTWPDYDNNHAPDAFEDSNGDLCPDGFCEVLPVTGFGADVVSGNMPLTVHFTSLFEGTGEPITSWAWNFGDGATSTESNPSHTYMAEDPVSFYTVSLTVTTEHGSRTFTKNQYIAVYYVCEYEGQITFQGALFAEILLAADPLSDDLKALLVACGQSSWPLFDWEGLEANFSPSPPATVTGDGLPDEAQMALIEYVACRPWLDANEVTVDGMIANKALFLEDVATLASGNPDFAALGLFADYFAAMIGSSIDMKDTINALILALTGGATGLPQYSSYVVFSYGPFELFSADGDLDGDWYNNLDEYEWVVMFDGGDIEDFVNCATDDWCPWTVHDLPVTGILGLGLLAGALLVGAALAIAKK